jgi:hypothetical protein
MADVGIEFFCPRAAADGNGSLPTPACLDKGALPVIPDSSVIGRLAVIYRDTDSTHVFEYMSQVGITRRSTEQ